MSYVELFKIFKEDPPVMVKVLQDIIGDYVIDIFGWLPDTSNNRSNGWVYFYPYLFYDKIYPFMYSKSVRVSHLLQPHLISPGKREQISRAYIYQYLRENTENPYAFSVIDHMAKHIQSVFRGETYAVRLSHGQRVSLTIPFFTALAHKML